ncbi:unnamed protein product [Malus baccata var. baccata]
MDMGRTSTLKKVRRQRAPGHYKGVQMRAWGRWVSEIRLPKSGIKIWLGTYDAPDQAARAYDAAVYSLPLSPFLRKDICLFFELLCVFNDLAFLFKCWYMNKRYDA